MAISQETKSWLQQAGFKNYCFISYPHSGTQMREFAKCMQQAIEDELRFHTSTANVYLDSSHIPPGANWPENLSQNLCASVSMVALLSPVYLEEEHAWCGREWAAMEKLGRARLPNTSIKPIIPVLFRKTELPSDAAARQPIDLSRVSLLGRRYFSTGEFRAAILKIVEQIIEIATMIQRNECHAEVDRFQFPDRSSFAQSAPQPPPLRTN
jgi:hypothetical protein